MVVLSLTAQPALPEQQPSELLLYGAALSLTHYHVMYCLRLTRTLSSYCPYSYSKTLLGPKHMLYLNTIMFAFIRSQIIFFFSQHGIDPWGIELPSGLAMNFH